MKKDKYIWWGLLGVGVAALFYFMTKKDIQSQPTSTVQVPYLVPTTGASPSADTSLSNQPNIVGSSPNSTVPNYSNPYSVATSYAETPNTWGFWPQLNSTPPNQPTNNVTAGFWNVGGNQWWINPEGGVVGVPGRSAPHSAGGQTSDPNTWIFG